MNENAMMAEFADNVWRNYIKPKYEQEFKNNVTWYKAKVVSNNTDGTLTVQKPFDNPVTVHPVDGMREVTAGNYVTVLEFGKGNALNHIAIGDSTLDYAFSGTGNYGINLARATGYCDTKHFAGTGISATDGVLTLTPPSATSNAYSKYLISYLRYKDYKGKTLTLSFDARAVSGSPSLNVYFGVNIASRFSNAFNAGYDNWNRTTFSGLSTNWKRYALTVKFPSGFNTGVSTALVDDSYVTFGFGTAIIGNLNPVQVKNYMLEEGTTAHDWKPAPEDDEMTYRTRYIIYSDSNIENLCYADRTGNRVDVCVYAQSKEWTTAYTNYATLPIGYRPENYIKFAGNFSSNGYPIGYLTGTINPSGGIYFRADKTVTGRAVFSVTYTTKDPLPAST